MVNRKRMGYNDVGWGILPGNYSRFLTQVEPGSGDVGVWHVDDSIYGRFARSFDHRNGKKQMRFQLDEKFDAEQAKINVIYLDKGRGAWSLGISGRSGKKQVKNTGSGEWKTMSVTISGKHLRGATIQVNYEGGDDTVFHLIEVERA